ncbi:MAG: type II toxin-antitoxin system HicB family antitoxin [Phycisphaerales bacterium]|nr:type II toxin-antitoxin system HicB family antitoxin [Phycisphaerales bacterium]
MKNDRAVRSAFEPRQLAQARAIAEQYGLVIERDPELGFVGRTLEMPGVMADGRTLTSCVANILEATTASVATLLEQSHRVPTPASQRKRDQQVNIRVSAEERLRLQSLAERDGFASISDYVRAAALRAAS